jgi:hypothetical protein
MNRMLLTETENDIAMTVIVRRQADQETGVDERAGWFPFDADGS